jgi:hypothetical protein
VETVSTPWQCLIRKSLKDARTRVRIFVRDKFSAANTLANLSVWNSGMERWMVDSLSMRWRTERRRGGRSLGGDFWSFSSKTWNLNILQIVRILLELREVHGRLPSLGQRCGTVFENPQGP